MQVYRRIARAIKQILRSTNSPYFFCSHPLFCCEIATTMRFHFSKRICTQLAVFYCFFNAVLALLSFQQDLNKSFTII